jgi:hypothetical protein
MLVNYLITKKDNAEIIRDRIALILTAELAHQYELALDHTPEPDEQFDPEDYHIGVYMENQRPWDIKDFPAVNIQLLSTAKDEKPGSTVGKQKNKIHFAIDCYARGKIVDSETGEPVPDDSNATLSAWFVGRLVRNILMAGEDTYLGLRGLVQKREVSARNTGVLENLSESAAAVSVCRILFDVDSYEDSPQASYESLDGMEFKIQTADGRIILADLQTPPYKDEED